MFVVCCNNKGVKIDRDSHGNIFLTKLADCDVIVKGFRDPDNHCIAADVVETSGRVGAERTKVVSRFTQWRSDTLTCPGSAVRSSGVK